MSSYTNRNHSSSTFSLLYTIYLFFINFPKNFRKISNFAKNNGKLRRQLIITYDVILTTASFPAAVFLRENFTITDKNIQPLLYGTPLIFILSLLIFRFTGVHQIMWRYTSPRDLLRVFQALLLIALIFVSLMFFFDRLIGVSRSSVVIFYLISLAGLSCSRIIYGCLVLPCGTTLRRSGEKTSIRALLAGDVPSTAQLATTIQSHYCDKIQIVGVVGRADDIGRVYQGMTVLGQIANIKQVFARLDVLGMRPDQIIVPEREKAADPDAYEGLRSIGGTLNLKVISSSSLGHFDLTDEPDTSGSAVNSNTTQRDVYERLKRCLDVCIAGAALLLLGPLLLTIAFVTLVTDRSPILFKQVRSGRHMQEFLLLKFRTMRDPFDSRGRLLSDEERVSNFGRFLRVTRLDELPQLWNILMGDMALIGPRPLHIRDLSLDQAIIVKRHSVLPGLTGWAQVNGGQLLSSKQKISLDLFYINSPSIFLDFKIIIMTIRMMIIGELFNYPAIREAERLFEEQSSEIDLAKCEHLK